jgi:hypothetical protein
VATAESGERFLDAVLQALEAFVRELDAGRGGSYATRGGEDAS